MTVGIRERTAHADWAEYCADPKREAPLAAHAAYADSLMKQWQAALTVEHCGAVWPHGEARDVLCQLPRNHRCEEHWHPPLWPTTPDLLWFDEPEAEDMIP